MNPYVDDQLTSKGQYLFDRGNMLECMNEVEELMILS
jgi:hypothetical protein